MAHNRQKSRKKNLMKVHKHVIETNAMTLVLLTTTRSKPTPTSGLCVTAIIHPWV